MATFIENYRRLERLAYLIKRKSTGTPAQLADKMNVAERTALNLLAILRDLSPVEIKYCRTRRSYYFDGPAEISFQIIVVVEDDGEVIGGRNFFSRKILDADFLQWKGASLYC